MFRIKIGCNISFQGQKIYDFSKTLYPLNRVNGLTSILAYLCLVASNKK